MEPVTTAETKLHLRVDHSDEDALIERLVSASREWLEIQLDRTLVTSTWRIKLDGFGWQCYSIPAPPLQSVSSVTYLDTAGASQTLSSSAYDVITSTTPGYIQLAQGYSWPATKTHPEAVTITYIAGYGLAASVPYMLKAAILLMVGHYYEHREAATEGMAITEVPMGVQRIVQDYRAMRF